MRAEAPRDRAKILAFDCSGNACSAAIVADGVLVAHRFEERERGHAAVLMPQIQEAMAEAGLDFSDLDAVATTIGPGSFTGLRIGIAAAKGLSLGASIPTLGVTTFDAYRCGLLGTDFHSHPLIVAIDSKRGSLFVRKFTSAMPSNGEDVEAHAAEIIQADAVAEWLPAGEWVVAGDGVSPFAMLQNRDITIHPALVDAKRVAIALRCPEFALKTYPSQPLYMRAPDAVPPIS